MAPIVLVHGAWHGGWCWQRLAPLLRARGHEVHRPTLTGLGDRAHLRPLLGDALGLDTHVDDVVGLLEHEDLHDVVLVGHSYGGMVVTGVADRAADRLAHLLYLDAFLPEPGRAMFDVLRPERRDLFQEQARRSGGLVPSPPPQAFGVTDRVDAEWVAARLCPQPVRTFAQPLPLGPAPALPRTYLHCTAGAVVATFAPFAERVRDDPAWEYAELDAGHDVMLTAPDVLAAALPVGPQVGADRAAAVVAERAAVADRVAALARQIDDLAEQQAHTTHDDEHDPEGVTIGYERAHLRALLASASQELDDLDRAAARLSAGRYGRCVRCGAAIAEERLDALPAVETCIACTTPRRRR